MYLVKKKCRKQLQELATLNKDSEYHYVVYTTMLHLQISIT